MAAATLGELSVLERQGDQATADAVLILQYLHVVPAAVQRQGGCQAGHAGPEHEDAFRFQPGGFRPRAVDERYARDDPTRQSGPSQETASIKEAHQHALRRRTNEITCAAGGVTLN